MHNNDYNDPVYPVNIVLRKYLIVLKLLFLIIFSWGCTEFSMFREIPEYSRFSRLVATLSRLWGHLVWCPYYCHCFRQTLVLISCFIAEFWLHFCNFRRNFILIHHELLLSWVLGKIFEKSYFLMRSLTVYSDWEVYGEHSFLHRVQLPVKDHPGTAVALYQVQVWTTHQRADCSTPRLRHHSGEVRIAPRTNGWGRGQIFVIKASVALRR